MNTIEAAKHVDALMGADVPVFLWGAPGIGKSDLVRQLAAGRPLIDFRAVLLDPVDLRGVPSVESGVTRWNPPAFLPVAARDGEGGILFMDELNAAPMSVQAALFQLILDRRLGEYQLPASWRIIAAGNRQSDRAAAQRMPSALANRFAHIDVDADPAAWAAWANGASIIPEVIAFIRFRPALLHKMDGQDLRAFPTPRAWAKLSAVLASAGAAMALSLATALVGEAAAIEFSGFLSVYRDLPRLDAIVADPAGTRVPLEPSALYALACALARMATPANLAAIVAYLARVPAEFGVMAMADAIKRDPALKETRAFVTWAVQNQAVQL